MCVGTDLSTRSDARIAAGSLWSGANLRMTCKFTRSLADLDARRSGHLARRCFAVSVDIVVAGLPQGSETLSLNRYPSPDGRSCAMLRRPPFFDENSKCYSDRRSVAQSGSARLSGIANACDGATGRGTSPLHDTRGPDQCTQPTRQALPASSSSPLPGAAAPFPSRLFSVRAQVPALRPCLTVTLRRVPSSVRPATSPIARRSRIAVSDPARAHGAQSSLIQPSVRFRAPVAFSSSRPDRKSRAST